MSSPLHPVIDTIRKGMIGSLTDFVQDAGFIQHIDLIVELVYELAAYREEDVRLFPSFYLIGNTQDEDPLSVIAPGADRIEFGNCSQGTIDGAKVLKDTANLATCGWSVFVDVDSLNPRYGLFRSELLPVSLSSAEHMANPSSDSGSALLVRNCAHNCVELLAPDGRRMEFGLTAARPASVPMNFAFRELAESVVQDSDSAIRDKELRYLQRFFSESCQRCHGTLVAVLAGDLSELPVEFSDGVILAEPLDLIGAFRNLDTEGSANALARLHAHEALVRGMIQSDGITVMSADGCIRAFRVFVKPNEEEQRSLANLDIRGGARSRAFEVLNLRVGSSLSCAFFRSQDGTTKCVR